MAGGSRWWGGGSTGWARRVQKVSHQRLQSLHPSRPGGCDGGRSARSGGSPWRRKTAFRRASARSAPRVQFAQTLLAQLPRCPATRDSEIGPATCTLCARTPFPRRARKRTIHPAAPPRRLTAPPRSPSTHLVLGLMRSNHLKFQQHSDPRARLQDRPRAKFQSTYSTKSTNRSIIGCIGWLKIGALFRTGRRTVQNVPRAWHSPRPSSKRAHVRVCWPFRESSGAPR